MPRQKQSQISKSYIPTPPHPQGHGMLVKCEEPIDELTVQVWLLFIDHLPNFKYCTVCKQDGITDGQTTRLLDAPGEPLRPGT